MNGTVAPSARSATTALTPERGRVSSAARIGTGSYGAASRAGDGDDEERSDGEAGTGSDDMRCAYAAGARASRLDLAEKTPGSATNTLSDTSIKARWNHLRTRLPDCEGV